MLSVKEHLELLQAALYKISYEVEFMIKLLKSKKFIATLLIIVTILLLIIYFQQKTTTAEQPVAKDGYLDLSNWNFDKNGNVKLD